jgi:hypothetical protein
MDERLRCQCRRWPASPCDATMTQEDLRCDACRDGCSLVTIGGGVFKPADQPSFHVKARGMRITMAPRPELTP